MQAYRKILITAGIIVAFYNGGCTKQQEQIPNVSFSATVFINDPAISSNPVIIRSDASGRRIGINGIVLYRVSPAEFYAFDLMCPHEKQMGCEVEIEDGASAACECCGSLFLIATGDGNVVKGPAKWPLKTYSSRVSGNYLTIWN